MIKTFAPGARVRLIEPFHNAKAGTEYEVIEMVKPGFFAEGTVKVAGIPDSQGWRRVKSVPRVDGMGDHGLIHSQFLEEVR